MKRPSPTRYECSAWMSPDACFAKVHSLRTRLAHAATSRSVLAAQTASASRTRPLRSTVKRRTTVPADIWSGTTRRLRATSMRQLATGRSVCWYSSSERPAPGAGCALRRGRWREPPWARSRPLSRPEFAGPRFARPTRATKRRPDPYRSWQRRVLSARLADCRHARCPRPPRPPSPSPSRPPS